MLFVSSITWHKWTFSFLSINFCIAIILLFPLIANAVLLILLLLGDVPCFPFVCFSCCLHL